MPSQPSQSQGFKRAGPLSSQTRKWGDDENEVPRTSSWVLNSDEWPPSPPRAARKPVASVPPPAVKAEIKDSTFSGSVSSRPVATSGARVAQPGRPYPSSSNNNAAKPAPAFRAASTSGSTSTSKSTSSKLATTSSTSSSSVKPALAPIFKSASIAAASTSSVTTSSGSLPPTRKRTLPWENLEASSKPSASKSSNFHTVSGSKSGAFSKVKGNMLMSDAMNIKQKVILSPEQQMVLKLVVDDGKNVFFTGSAGTGKSVLLREIIASLKKKYNGRADAVAVTASTGMAACNIGGSTIHSWGGIGLGAEETALLVGKIKKNRNANSRWQRTLVLIIDEVSMVDGLLFDKLAGIGAALKKKPGVPFGGIQLVVTGDFFQLPPVTKGVANFAFEAKSWSEAIHHTVNLTQVFRQKSTEFIDMLNEMRFGQLSAASIEKFRKLNRVPKYDDDIEPTELFPRREEVENSNQNKLRLLPGEETVYTAEDWVDNDYGGKNTYLENFMAPRRLVLKVGAQVMLIKNLDTNLVNGTIGRVVGFGMGDDDLDPGMLSEGEYEAQQKKKVKLAAQVASGKMEMPPLIEWRTVEGPVTRMMAKEEFKAEEGGKKKAQRRQYPLILAWAMSIHKSQGQTLPRVKVDLGKVFEKGQSYVALSRATCLDGLQVLRFDPKKVEAHPKVISWSKTLEVLT